MATAPTGETSANHKWEAVTYWPLTAAAVAFLVTYTVHVVAEVHGVARVLTTSIITATWVVFAFDYLVRFLLAKHRAVWFRSHLIALGMVIFPPIRSVQLLDAFTRIASMHRSAGNLMRARLLIYGIGSALILVWYTSLVVLEAERHAPGANITNFGDAVWWAFCTVTAVGYGDYAPVTAVGRVYAVILMVGGVMLVGLIVASFSSWVIERVSAGHREHRISENHTKIGGSHASAPKTSTISEIDGSGGVDPQHGA